MAEIYGRVDSLDQPALPISDETNVGKDDELIINFHEIPLGNTINDVDGGCTEFSGEQNPHDAWLPITESRNGSILSATFHLLCSGIGTQVLSLPLAFVSLGWFWGIICLSLLFSWQFYTTWLLVNLHESAPALSGIRYSRYIHLSIVAFGEKLGKLLAAFPTMSQANGTCMLYIFTGAATMESLFLSMCDDDFECRAKTLTRNEWFLLFICIAIFIALFFPNLNSLASISFIGSTTALAYCSITWILPLSKGGPDDHVETTVVLTGGDASQIRSAFTGLEIIALAFRGHNLVLEIQGTLPTNRENPSRKRMWKGVVISCLLIAMCMYPLAIAGYWAYRDKIPQVGGILGGFTNFHQSSTSKNILRAIYLLKIINYLCAFQIYTMPVLDNFSGRYVAKKNGPCPIWFRSGIRLFFGGFAYVIVVYFPFLRKLGKLLGAIALPLTFVYPCFMWIAIKKPQRFSTTWCLNMGLGSSGAVLSVTLFAMALWALIFDGLEANFVEPKLALRYITQFFVEL